MPNLSPDKQGRLPALLGQAIQVLLGHSRIDTTARYAAVTPRTISAIVSPLDQLQPKPPRTQKTLVHQPLRPARKKATAG